MGKWMYGRSFTHLLIYPFTSVYGGYMGSAYTPGLKVSARTTIEQLRRLPLKGDVVVKGVVPGTPNTVVALTELPGRMQTVKLAEKLGVEPSELNHILRVKVGDRIEKGTLLAQTKGLFGLFKAEERAQVEGILELI